MAKKIFNRTKLDSTKYVNTETGETLADEMPNIVSANKVTDLVLIDFKNYVVISREVMLFLKEILPPQEIGRLYNLSSLIKTNYNVLVNDSKDLPYEDKELAEEILLSRNKYYDFMQKLYKLSIVYKLSGYYNGKPRTMIVLNPYLVRNTKLINKDLLPIFEDLSSKDTQEKLKRLLKSN